MGVVSSPYLVNADGPALPMLHRYELLNIFAKLVVWVGYTSISQTAEDRLVTLYKFFGLISFIISTIESYSSLIFSLD